MVKKSSGKPAKKSTAVTKTVKAAAAKPAAVSENAKNTVGGLRTWNLVAAGALALQAVLLLVFGADKAYPVVASYLATDPLQTAAQGQTVLVFAIHNLFDISLAYLLAAVLLLAAIASLLVATAKRPQYEAGLAAGRHRARWYSGAVTGGLMMVIVGMLVGVQDIALLLALFGLTAIMYLCETVVELRSPGNLRAQVIGKFAGFLPWVLTGLYLIFGGLFGSALSVYVYVIFGLMYAWFAATAAFAWFQYKAKGKWANQVFVERAYIVLGVAAPTVLTWLAFAGVLR